MTDTKNYKVRGADVTVTASVYKETINLHITVDLSALDADEPDHSAHCLVSYFALSGYKSPDTYWWCKRVHTVTVHTGSQAKRVVKYAIARIDDAIAMALLARTARKSEMATIFA